MATVSRYLSVPLPNGSRISLILSLPFALIHIASLLIFFAPFHWYYLVTCLALLVVLKSGPGLSREKAGMLMCLSLLLAPYASANSFVAVLAIAIIPIFLTRPAVGLILLALADLPFFLSQRVIFEYSAWYWTAMLLLTFGVCAWLVWRARTQTQTA